MASFDKKGAGWRFRIFYVDKNGTKRSKTKQGFRTKIDAEMAARKIESEIDKGSKINARDVTLTEYWHKWLAAYKKGKHAPVTEQRYMTIEKQLTSRFKDTKLIDISPINWQLFINDFGAGLDRKIPSPRNKDTVGKLNGYVRAMVRSAINEQIIYTDFTFGVQLSGVAGDDEETKYLQLNEFKQVVNLSRERASYASVGNLAVYVSAMSGLRISEVLALTWPDVNVAGRKLHVRRSWDYTRKVFKPTKTKSSVRWVGVGQDVIDILTTVKHEQANAYIKSGYRDPDQMIFRTRQHEVLTATGANKTLKKIQFDLAILNPITFHGLRHTHVSYLIASDADIYYISKRLGHSNIAITLRVYSHLLDAHATEQTALAVNALDKLVNYVKRDN